MRTSKRSKNKLQETQFSGALIRNYCSQLLLKQPLQNPKQIVLVDTWVHVYEYVSER